MSRHHAFAPLVLLGLMCLTGCTFGNRPISDSSQCQGNISVVTLTECPGGPYTVYICAHHFTVEDCFKEVPARICIWDGWVIVTAPDGTVVTTPDVAVTVMEQRPTGSTQPTSSSGAEMGGLARAGGASPRYLALTGEMNLRSDPPKPPKPILIAKLTDKSDLIYTPDARAKVASKHWFGGSGTESEHMAVVSTEGVPYKFCDVSTGSPPPLTPPNARNLDELKTWALTIDEYIHRVRMDVSAKNCTPHRRK